MRIISDEKGWAMPIALLLLVVLAIVAAAMFDYGVTDMKHVTMDQQETRAHYLARSGAESIAKWIVRDPSLSDSRVTSLRGTSSTNVTIDGVSVPVTVNVSGTNSNLIVRATYSDGNTRATVSRRLYRLPDVVAVGYQGEIFTFDTSATRWAKITNSSGNNWTSSNLNGVTWGGSSTDNLIVAVGDGGTIITSSGGTTWDARSSGVSSRLNEVAFGTLTVSGSQVNRFVAVGDSGVILISPDGRTWSSVTSGTSENLNGVAYGNGKFVAVGENGTVRYSTNGTTWTAASWNLSAQPSSWWDGTVVGYWHPEYYDYNDVTYANSRFMAVADRNLTEFGEVDFWTGNVRIYQDTPNRSYWATSADGTTWNISSNRINARTGTVDRDYWPRDLYCVAGRDNAFGAGGADGLSVQFDGQGAYSDSGVVPNSTRPTFYSITYSNSNSSNARWWAVGNASYVAHGIRASSLLSYMNIGATALYDVSGINPSSSVSVWQLDNMQN